MIAATARHPAPIPARVTVCDAIRWSLPYSAGVNVNHQYRPTRGGRRILSEDAQKFIADVNVIVCAQRATPPESGFLGLTLDLYPPDARRRDVDGPLKLVMDSICAALGIDDYRIAHVECWRHAPDKSNPRIEARLGVVVGLE